MLPSTMNAITIVRAGGPEVLQAVTRPLPQPAAGQVLIKVAFAGINRHDCGQRIRGFGPPGATDIPGLEVAGEVAAVGPGVTRWKAGDRVCALTNGGGYAQYCIAAQEVTLPIPEKFDLKLAASLPETLMTSWLNVFMLGRLKAGEWLLVHGGSSGIGTEFSVAVSAIMAKRAVVTGSQLRVSALSLKTEIVRQVTERVWPHLGTKVTPIIDSIMPLADAAGAHARMETSVHIGKILLEVTH